VTTTTRSTTHGASNRKGTPKQKGMYLSWMSMKTRCLNPNSPDFKDYMGRGITLCEEWEKFEAFWSDMEATWFPDSSIDRIDNDAHYNKANCRWATEKEQQNNRRNSRNVMVDGIVESVMWTARRVGMNSGTLRNWLKLGYSAQEIVDHWRNKPKGSDIGCGALGAPRQFRTTSVARAILASNGYRGIYFDKRTRLKKRWVARLHGNHLGYYATAKVAALAYDKAVIEAYGPEDPRLNFPSIKDAK
jgi:hypothetical protein